MYNRVSTEPTRGVRPEGENFCPSRRNGQDQVALAVENPDDGEEAGGAGELEDDEMLTPAGQRWRSSGQGHGKECIRDLRKPTWSATFRPKLIWAEKSDPTEARGSCGHRGAMVGFSLGEETTANFLTIL